MLTQDEFLKDVALHEMTVWQDDAATVRRHLKFSRPGTNVYRFDLITWPGHLCYTGDMGTYVFSRLHDMFEFFRADAGRINPSYWAEKLLAVDKTGGYEEFDPERFEQVIKEIRRGWMREIQDKTARRLLFDQVNDEVLSVISEDEHSTMQAAYNFEPCIGGCGGFVDLWDYNFKRPTYRYLWACYAIVWGIQQYDQRKSEVEAFERGQRWR